MKFSIKIILSVLFVVCLFKMPYGYYELVRFVGMVGFILLAYYDYNTNKALTVLWVASALLINPFFKVALGRTIWNIVDIVWAVIMITTEIIERRKAGTS